MAGKDPVGTSGGEKIRQSYFCTQCDFPSDVVGLLNPCSHVYCLTCASQMSDCVICRERVDGVRVVRGVGELWVSPLTLKGGVGAEGPVPGVLSSLPARLRQKRSWAILHCMGSTRAFNSAISTSWAATLACSASRAVASLLAGDVSSVLSAAGEVEAGAEAGAVEGSTAVGFRCGATG